MTMTPKERVLAAMKQESLDRPPVAIFTQSATLGQMEKTGAAWPEPGPRPTRTLSSWPNSVPLRPTCSASSAAGLLSA